MSRSPAPRVLLIINDLSPEGGAEVQLAHLARGLADLGHPVTLCCVGSNSVDPASFVERGIELVTLGAPDRGARARALPRLAKLARRADVVHCTMWDASLWGRLAAIAARRPVLVADHSTDRSVQISRSGAERGRMIALHYRLLDPFTYATVACATTQPALLESEGVAAEKIVYIPNGIPLDGIRAAAAGVSREDLGIPAGAPVLAQVGVFRAEKNQLGGVEAFARVRAAVPDAHLLLVGDGESRPQVEARARELGVEGAAHFLGLRRDVPALLALADLALLPSISDAMPMVVLEAMALGVPTLATDVGDVRWMLGGGGVCVPPADWDALVAAAIRLLGDEEERGALARAGLEAVQRFDSSAMAKSYSALIAAGIDGRPPRTAIPPPSR